MRLFSRLLGAALATVASADRTLSAAVAPVPEVARTSAPAARPEPFFVFGAGRPHDPTVFRVLATYLRETDYVSTGVTAAEPVLARRIGPSHRFQLVDSLEGIRAAATSSEQRHFIFYDIEHWPATPVAEQKDPTNSIAAAARLVHAATGLKFGIAPDGQFIGVIPAKCAYRLDAGIYRRVDWSQVDFLNIQAQRLLSDACADQLAVKDYVAFVTAIASEARRRHPGIIVSAQFSFRYTPPAKMIAAIRALDGAVDGYYLAYPDRSSIPNAYCTAANLEEVLRAFRPPVPSAAPETK